VVAGIHRRRDPHQRALGAAIRELRARRGLSQERLGEEGGLHRNYVGAIERGEINPTLRVLLKLCRGLAIPLTELTGTYERQMSESTDRRVAA
jgi:transcriptional regulator with XRE-family HTH domain